MHITWMTLSGSALNSGQCSTWQCTKPNVTREQYKEACITASENSNKYILCNKLYTLHTECSRLSCITVLQGTFTQTSENVNGYEVHCRLKSFTRLQQTWQQPCDKTIHILQYKNMISVAKPCCSLTSCWISIIVRDPRFDVHHSFPRRLAVTAHASRCRAVVAAPGTNIANCILGIFCCAFQSRKPAWGQGWRHNSWVSRRWWRVPAAVYDSHFLNQKFS